MDGDSTVRIYVVNGKPAGVCRSIPVVRMPETEADRISYGASARPASAGYRPSAAARAKAAAKGGRATKGRR